MADIFVFSKFCEDFDTLGECGPLTCTSAKVVEEANGTFELTIEHPIDPMGRWRYLVDGNLLQAEVPVRTTPEIDDNGAIVVHTEIWKVKTTASGGERAVYSKQSGGKKLATLNIRTAITVVNLTGSRYKFKYKKGYGYISSSAIEHFFTNPDIEASAASIELVAPAWSIRPQLFRIYAPEVSDQGVVATARHISYDLLGNLMGYSVDNPTCGEALGTEYGAVDSHGVKIPGILNNCIKPHDFVGRTNIADRRVIPDWTRVSPMDALLNPETGLLKLWSADLVRDQWELTVLDDAGLNRGVRIEYAKNLLSVKTKTDTSNLITSIYVLGQTSKGKALALAAGTYVVDGVTVVVDSSLTVNSPYEAEHALPHVYTLDLGSAAKAASGDASALLAARKKMIKACLDMFRNEQVDLPLLDMTIDFVALGDTEEGKQFKELENIYLFDRVTVWHWKLGVDVLTSVKRVEYDPKSEKFLSMELGSVRRNAKLKKLPTWELPPVQVLAYGAVSLGALDDSLPDELDLTNNGTVATVAQQFVTNCRITGEQMFKYLAGATEPTSPMITLTATLKNALMGRWQYLNGVEWTDYPLLDGNTSINETTLFVKPGHDIWTNDIATIRILTSDEKMTDSIGLYKVRDVAGLDGLTTVLSNPAQMLPKTSTGLVNFADSGTELRVLEGITELNYLGLGVDYTGVTNGSWKAKLTASGVTAAVPTGEGGVAPNHLSLGDITAMVPTSGTKGTVSITIFGKRTNGTKFTLTVVQSLAISLQGVTGADGAAGSNAKLISLLASGQIFNVPLTGIPTPSALTVTGIAQNTAITTWQYSIDGGAFSSSLPIGVVRVGDQVTITGLTLVAKTLAIRASDGTYSDTITIAKVVDGATGADAYTVILTNESQVFPGDVSNSLAGSASFDVIALKGGTPIASSVGTITGQVTGLTTAITNNGTTSTRVTITVTTSLVLAGVLSVPITVDGKSFTKKFSFAIGFKGQTGTTGSTGGPGAAGASAISAVVESTGGDAFKNGVGTSFMICRMFQNGVELDPLKNTRFLTANPTSGMVTGDFYYKYAVGSPKMQLMRYNGTSWIDVTGTAPYVHLYSYSWSRNDKDGVSLGSFSVTDTSNPTVKAVGKVIFVNGTNLDTKTTFTCEVN